MIGFVSTTVTACPRQANKLCEITKNEHKITKIEHANDRGLSAKMKT